MDSQSLQAYCRSSKSAAEICRKPLLWKQKIQKDYPKLKLEILNPEQYKSLWIKLQNLFIAMYYDTEFGKYRDVYGLYQTRQDGF